MNKKVYILSIIDECDVIITKASINKQKLIDFIINDYFSTHEYPRNLIKILRSDLKKYNYCNLKEYINRKFRIEEIELI